MSAPENELDQTGVNTDDHPLTDGGTTFGAALLEHALSNRLEELDALMKQHPDANVNGQAEDGSTVLHHACRNDSFEIIDVLASKANWNTEDNLGCTPLHLACEFSSPQAVQLGLRFKADPSKFTNAGEQAIHIAARRHKLEIVRTLVNHGVDINVVNADQRTALDISLLRDFTDLINFIQSVSQGVLSGNAQYRSFYELALGGAVSDSGGESSEAIEQTHIRIIKETWSMIQPIKEEFGAALYDQVVNVNIEISSLFADTRFASQKTAFLDMMGRSIQWLDIDFRRWEGKMAPLAQRHVGYGVKPEHYKYFRKAFLRTMRTFLDPWTETQEDAWIWYWSCIMNTLGFATQSSLLETELVPPAERAVHVFVLYNLWRTVCEDARGFGNLFYQKIFQAHPQMAELFSSTVMDRQGIRFFAMLNHTIKQVEDSGNFENDLIKLTYQHKVYGVKMEHVEAFGIAFDACITEILGDTYTDEAKTAVAWFWRRIHDCFEYGLEHAHHLADESKEKEDRRASLVTRGVMDSINEAVDGEELVPAGRSMGGVDLSIDVVSSARIFQPSRSLQRHL